MTRKIEIFLVWNNFRLFQQSMKERDEFIEVQIGLDTSVPLVIIATFFENTCEKLEINK